MIVTRIYRIAIYLIVILLPESCVLDYICFKRNYFEKAVIQIDGNLTKISHDDALILSDTIFIDHSPRETIAESRHLRIQRYGYYRVLVNKNRD